MEDKSKSKSKSKQDGTYLGRRSRGREKKDPWLWKALEGVDSRRGRVSMVFTQLLLANGQVAPFYRLGWKSEQGSFSILHTAFIGFPNSFWLHSEWTRL